MKRDWFLRQYHTGAWLGALKGLFSNATFYLTPINLFMLAATTYNTTAREYIHQFAPWFNFFMFFGLLICIALGAMMFEYKVVIPSSVRFNVIQNWVHGNPAKAEFAKVNTELKEIKELLSELKDSADKKREAINK